MDVLSIITTVYSLCQSIEKWIEELVEKELVIQEISSIVTQIRNILAPFSQSTKPYDGKGELQLSESIRCVGDVLERTKEHLIIYKYKKSRKIQIASFLRPGAVIQRLREDHTQLNSQLIILLTSFAVVGYFRSRDDDDRSDASTVVGTDTWNRDIGTDTKNVSSPSDALADEEAREFWKDYIGGKITFASKELFIDRLEQWYGRCLDRKMADTIIMRLDEYNAGGISPYSLAHGLEDETLKKFVARYAQREVNSLIPITTAKSNSIADESLTTPLLVWVDDRTELIAHEVRHARSLGVHVIELESTAVAKAWVEANMAFLCANDTASRLRFISDNVRKEYSSSSQSSSGRGRMILNHTAGENFLHFLRGRMLRAPVLIYCGRSIARTEFVDSYECAGSTFNPATCLSYITNLAAGQSDDDAWMGYQGRRGITQGRTT